MAFMAVISSRSFRNRTGYWRQGTCFRITSLLAPVIGTEVAETVTSLLKRLSWVRNSSSSSVPSYRNYSRWPGSGLCGLHRKCWLWFQSLFELACNLNDAAAFSPLLEVSPFSDRKECGCEECGGFGSWAWTFSDGSSRGSRVAEAWNLATVV